MGALAQARSGIKTILSGDIPLPLDGSQKAFIGGIACGDSSTGGVKPGQASTTLLRIGEFAQTIDNSASTAQITVMVSLDHEVFARWYDNATGANKVLVTDLFNDVYMLDDHTVTKASSGNSKAGRVWGVDTLKGVLVESQTL
jgi:hypothetical protein